ncbi:MAG: KTSC domain-containing protein [Chthoniobacterales bacterium]|nr:KTSC domain-containing protein [Chthoniobacterales bacterium]
MRKRVVLDSSAIAGATYDSERRTLVLEFREGDTYRYFAVPQFAFDALLVADSAGAFWNGVKDNYRYELLD